MMVGEAGVGKTRLAAELGDEAVEQPRRARAHRPLHPLRRDRRLVPDRRDGRGRVLCRPRRRRRRPARARPTTRSPSVLGGTIDAAEIGRIVEGLLALMGKAPHSEGVDPSRAREDALRAGLAFLAALADAATARAHPLGPPLGRPRAARVPPPPAPAPDRSAGAAPRDRPGRVRRGVVAATGPAQRGQRPPRPARRRRHRRAARRAACPTRPPRSAPRSATGPAATRSSSRSSRRWPATPAARPGAELPATLHGLVAARLDRLPPRREGRCSRTRRSSA